MHVLLHSRRATSLANLIFRLPQLLYIGLKGITFLHQPRLFLKKYFPVCLRFRQLDPHTHRICQSFPTCERRSKTQAYEILLEHSLNVCTLDDDSGIGHHDGLDGPSLVRRKGRLPHISEVFWFSWMPLHESFSHIYMVDAPSLRMQYRLKPHPQTLTEGSDTVHFKLSNLICTYAL